MDRRTLIELVVIGNKIIHRRSNPNVVGYFSQRHFVSQETCCRFNCLEDTDPRGRVAQQQQHSAAPRVRGRA